MTPVWRLPPHEVHTVVRALAETIDWGLAAYGIPEAWKQSRGDGVRVAVLDTGLGSHADLPDPYAAFNFAGGGESRWDEDRVGHGTHVAGIIAARADGRGLVGVAPECELLAARVLGDDGAGDDESVAEGIRWAVVQGADVLNLSLGSPLPSQRIAAACTYAADSGRFVICAAGNEGRGNSVNYPARLESVVAVAAVDRRGRAASFSSRGNEVDIAAPGQDVLSTWPGDRYARLSGTSMAAPFVSGVVALVLAKHKSAGGRTPVGNVRELLAHLRRTARDAGPAGRDPSYGFGLIDPGSLLAADGDGPQPKPPATAPPAPAPAPAKGGGIWVWIPGGEARGP